MAYSSSSNDSIIQSSSSFSPKMTLTRKHYDVFVSFRGTDTRHNFTDHLFAALQRKGIVPFSDAIKLRKGDSIAPALLRAIEGSQVFVVVFSKDYASSTWCLEELQNILHCAQLYGKRVLPVFCDVSPSEVRKQNGSYEESFATHEERFKHNSEMVQRWRTALTQVANLSGWDIRHKPQYAEIEKIVEEIINVLGHKFSSLPKDFVGMHSLIEELEKLLLLGSVDDVRVVGICGMGGIGKTTLATVLYGRISHQFDACCCIDDISKIYRQDGPIGVQKQILNQTLGDEHHQINNLYSASNLIRSRLCRVRVLIILDNVDQAEQLEKLALDRECLGAGSRIIIISRDKHILKQYEVDVVFKVPLLNQTESRQLFCQKAFKLDHIMSSYERLTYIILYYANGLPLAIKVLGSFLFGRDVSEWRSALARLKESPNKDIMDVLRLSFDVLHNMEKEIFLDIACFFYGEEKERVKDILDCCGFHADIGLRVLSDKSLISIKQNRIEMHGLLIALGRNIVQENSSKEPRKWSRLWRPEHFYNVVLENMEKGVEAIVMIGEKEKLMAEALSKMSHLRFLILNGVGFSGSLTSLSNELRYVEWHEYPFMYLPSSFQPNQLVRLILKNSNIKQLWEGKKYLPNLKTLDVRHSTNLMKTPDFEGVPNLELLNLEGCLKLVQMDPSIGLLRKLVYLNLKDCKNLRSIPNNIFGLSSLLFLDLFGCSKVFNSPMPLEMLESALHSQLTSSIIKWVPLPFLYLYPTPSSTHKELLPSLPGLSCLRMLDISFCGVSQIPDAIGCLRWLEMLDLGGNNFVSLPSLMELSRLVYLNLEHCKQLESLPEFPSSPVIDQDYYCAKGGLYIFNCPKLGERERYCSSRTFSWIIQFIQAIQQSSLASFHEIDIVVPGSEIPRWFNNQGVGGSISIDPSPIMHDNNIIGVAWCAVFSVEPVEPDDDDDDDDDDEWGRGAHIYLVFQKDGLGPSIRFPLIIERGLITVKSDHMWLRYFPREPFIHILSTSFPLQNLDDIKMKASSSDCPGLELHVKNCGYRWVSKQDLQQHNFTMMHGRNSFAQNRKFLAVEEG